MGMGFDRKFGLVETGNCHGDAIGVFTGALDIIGRVGLRLLRLGKAVEHGEQPVETDRRAIKGREVYVTHDVLLWKRRVAINCP